MATKTNKYEVIEMTRGDTCPLKFQRLDARGNVITEIADKMYFTVKRNFNTKPFVLQKTLDDMTFDSEGYYHFIINPEDTEKLMYGDYAADVEVLVGSYKYTVSKFILRLTDEATWYLNEGPANVQNG